MFPLRPGMIYIYIYILYIHTVHGTPSLLQTAILHLYIFVLPIPYDLGLCVYSPYLLYPVRFMFISNTQCLITQCFPRYQCRPILYTCVFSSISLNFLCPMHFLSNMLSLWFLCARGRRAGMLYIYIYMCVCIYIYIVEPPSLL